MKLREDQVKLTEMLKETVTLLCKNGLQFQQGFTVDALIGITTDDRETFLVMLNESVRDSHLNQNDNADGSDAAGRKYRVSRKRSSESIDHTTTMKRRRSNVDDYGDVTSDEDNDSGAENNDFDDDRKRLVLK